LDYFSENVSLIKFSGRKSRALTLVFPLSSCVVDNFSGQKIALAEIIIQLLAEEDLPIASTLSGTYQERAKARINGIFE